MVVENTADDLKYNFADAEGSANDFTNAEAQRARQRKGDTGASLSCPVPLDMYWLWRNARGI